MPNFPIYDGHDYYPYYEGTMVFVRFILRLSVTVEIGDCQMFVGVLGGMPNLAVYRMGVLAWPAKYGENSLGGI